jgi:Uma2 family endonuclease
MRRENLFGGLCHQVSLEVASAVQLYRRCATFVVEPTQMNELHSDSDRLPAALERGPLLLHAGAGVELTREQFFRLCLLNPDLRLERTAKGDITVMPPAGGRTGARNSNLLLQIGTWAHADGTGVTFDSSTGFELPNGATRSPDVAWVRRTRLATLTPEQKERFLPLCPDVVVELLSPSDSLQMTEEKMGEYIANGAQLGWLIDPVRRRVQVYRPGRPPEVLDNPPRLAGDPEMLGCVLDLAPVWDPGF